MKKLNNKGFLLVETIVVATFTLTVLIALFLQFKNLLVSYHGSYNYNTVEGIYNLNAVKNYIMQYQNSDNPLNKQLKGKKYLGLYNGSCNNGLGIAETGYCDELMKQGNFKTVIFSSSDPTALKEYLKSNNDPYISEEMKNLIKRLEKVEHQNRLIAEFNDGTLATVVFGVDNDSKPADPNPVVPETKTVYRWGTEKLNIGDSIEGIETTSTKPDVRKSYLKYDVLNNKITASYVCFITDTEHCMQGGNADYYQANKELLQGQATWFTNGGGNCNPESNRFYCTGSGFLNVYATDQGLVNATESSNAGCAVNVAGESSCSE